MQIPFGNLSLEIAQIRGDIDKCIARVLDRGWFVLGEEAAAFEREFATFLGAGHVIGCGNGTDAITLALKALGMKPGDEVITVANTCVPTVTGIRDAGCSVRLVDCDPQTLQMSASSLSAAITGRTRAVVVVHLYGSCPDMTAITEICRRADLPLVEDCAQAHGARWQGRPAGRWGRISAWSFYPSKNLGAYGDGGAVATDDSVLAERLFKLRNYGQRVRYYHDEEGRNSRLDEFQAAILRVKLKHLDQWNERRRQIADHYSALLADAPVKIPAVDSHCLSVRHLYPIRVETGRREMVRTELQAQGVQTQIHYPVPIHLQKAYVNQFPGESYPASEEAAGELLSLPLYPQMSDDQVRTVAESLIACLKWQK